jgi:hypothetical protein
LRRLNCQIRDRGIACEHGAIGNDHARCVGDRAVHDQPAGIDDRLPAIEFTPVSVSSPRPFLVRPPWIASVTGAVVVMSVPATSNFVVF